MFNHTEKVDIFKGNYCFNFDKIKVFRKIKMTIAQKNY